MDLKLTTWERVTITSLVGGLRGDAALMYTCIKVFDVVELTDEEKQEIGLRQIGNSLNWNDPDRKWEISIKDEEVAALVLKVVKENEEWPAARAREVLGLYKALDLPWS